MACITKVGPNISDLNKYAARRGLNVASFPLKDNSTVKILSNETKFEEYHVKNGEITEVMKKSLPKFEDFGLFVAQRLEELQSNAAKGINVVAEWTKSLTK